MIGVYSQVQPGLLLFLIVRYSEITRSADHFTRVDYSDHRQPLQVAALRNGNESRSFAAHKHVPHERQTDITQESWYVVRGSVKVNLFDVNDMPAEVDSVHLYAGDMLITFFGGHEYTMDADAVVVEYKTGPFEQDVKDKVLL